MKDTYFYDDVAYDSDAPQKPIVNDGLRHSIRARSKRTTAGDLRQATPTRPTARKRVSQRPAPLTQPFAEPVQPQTEPLVLKTPIVAAPPAAPAANLPRWADLPRAMTSNLRRSLTTDAPELADASDDPEALRAFDLLRTKLRQTMKENGWTSIAVTAPTAGCGTTFTAVNLARSLSRVAGSRTVLMDMNLRNPGVADAFDLAAPGAMGTFLSGDVDVSDHMIRTGDTLALGLNDASEQHPADILQDLNTAATLREMREALEPQLVIYDLPPMLAHDDVTAFLPQVDAVLLVSDGTQTMGRQLRDCERQLNGKVPLLGVVLNQTRSATLAQHV